jgi:5-methylthioribose kinase
MTPAEAEALARAMGVDVRGAAVALDGGHLNHVFRVPHPGGTVVLKHAPPFVATLPDVPLDPDRLRHEALGLSLAARLWPGHAPRLLAYDAPRSALLMSDLGDTAPLDAWLERGGSQGVLEELGEALGLLHGLEVPALAWFNPGVQRTRLQVQYSQVSGWLEALGADAALGRQAAQLGAWLCEPGVAPVMGDLWPASIRLAEPGHWAVIDWELSTLGQPLQDVAHLRAHLFLADPDRAPAWVERFESGYRRTAPPWDGRQHDGARVHEASELLARTVGAFVMVPPTDPRHERAVGRALSLLDGPPNS